MKEKSKRGAKAMILSASRRTDIPAFYSQWFINRLRAGEVYIRNPMNHRQVTRLLFSPETVDCIVFWTKDPENMLPLLPQIDQLGYRYYFQYTLTPYGGELEPGLRGLEQRVDTFIRLSKLLGRERVVWRYDPIVFNSSWGFIQHVDAFTELCQRLAPYTDTCVISFVDLYYKNEPAAKAGLLRPIAEEEMHETCQAFAQIAAHHHLTVRTCCEALDFTPDGVLPGSCIDKERLEKVCGFPLALKPDSGQRDYCHCFRSTDVGTYNTCPHGCVYCYAAFSAKLVASNRAAYDPDAPLLCGTLSGTENITVREAKSSREFLEQLSLFGE